jgi:transposase
MGQCQRQIAQLQHQVETLQGRVAKTSQTSSKPLSSDAPFNTPKRQRQTSSGTRGGQHSHRGNGPTLLSPTAVHRIEPGPCPCGHGTLVALTPSSTHQVIELPPIEMEVHHFILHQGLCQGCGRQRTSWRLVQDFCHSVFHIPLSLGAVHKVIQRVSQALVPHHEAMATLAHQAPGLQ